MTFFWRRCGTPRLGRVLNETRRSHEVGGTLWENLLGVPVELGKGHDDEILDAGLGQNLREDLLSEERGRHESLPWGAIELGVEPVGESIVGP